MGKAGSIGIPCASMNPLPIRLIPYYAWNNRGPAAMSMWLPLVLKD